MQTEYRYQLTHGFTTTRGSRLAVMIISSLFGIPVSFLIGILLGTILVVVADRFADLDAGSVAVPVLLGVILAGVYATFALYGVLKIVRTTALLAGSRLTVKSAFSSRTVDMRAATSVGIHQTQVRWRFPGRNDMIAELIVAGPFPTLYLRLATADALPMPPQDIAALMSFLSATSVPGSDHVIQYLRSY
ncbi:MAG TPA: hypothetical protein VN408_11080 [Actinoplanes sp.]|nr:hypothetical protein [Actinoplanes sp.]